MPMTTKRTASIPPIAVLMATPAERALARLVADLDLPTGVTVRPLFAGCETTLRIDRDGVDLGDLTSTTGFAGPVLVWFTGGGKRPQARRGYRFGSLGDGIAAAVCYADRGHWYGEI